MIARRPRLAGWKSGSLTAVSSKGWVQPFTRTVGRPHGTVRIVPCQSGVAQAVTAPNVTAAGVRDKKAPHATALGPLHTPAPARHRRLARLPDACRSRVT